MGKYHVEVTDTFGGEPNYCWVKSFIRYPVFRGVGIDLGGFAEMNTKLTQEQMFWKAHRKIADQNVAFMDMVRDGMTRRELQRLIERRPEVYKRFEGFLDTLPE